MSTFSLPRPALACSVRRQQLKVSASAHGGVGGFGGVRGLGPIGRPEPPRNPCGVFQLHDMTNENITLNDVADACEACSTARTPNERRQCFEVYGLDADKVDRYYDRVVTMEKLIDQGDSVGQGLVTSGGAAMLYAMAYLILRV